jgi:ribosomal protein L13E
MSAQSQAAAALEQELADLLDEHPDRLGSHALAAARAAGYDLPSLKDAGFTAAAFRAVGCNWADLKTAGFTAAEIKAAGCDVASARAVGFDLPSLKAAGFAAAAFRAAGCNWADLKTAGFTAAEIKSAGCDVAAARAAGFDLPSLKAGGFDCASLRDGGFDLKSLKAAGFAAVAFRADGCNWADLKTAGFTVAELKTQGFGLSDVRAAGYDLPSLKAAGFDAAAFRAAGCDWRALRADGFSVAEVRAAGCDLAAAVAAGYGGNDLVVGGRDIAPGVPVLNEPADRREAGSIPVTQVPNVRDFLRGDNVPLSNPSCSDVADAVLALSGSPAAAHREAEPVHLRSEEEIKRLERDIFFHDRIRQRLQNDFNRYEHGIREAQIEGDSELADDLARFIQNTEESLSSINDKLSNLEKQLESLNRSVVESRSEVADVGQKRWRLVAKQMFDVSRDPTMQRFFLCSFSNLHRIIMHSIQVHKLRPVQFKFESGKFKGQYFSTIFRYCSCQTFF